MTNILDEYKERNKELLEKVAELERKGSRKYIEEDIKKAITQQYFEKVYSKHPYIRQFNFWVLDWVTVDNFDIFYLQYKKSLAGEREFLRTAFNLYEFVEVIIKYQNLYREKMEKNLELLGHQTTRAENAEQRVAELEQEKQDLKTKLVKERNSRVKSYINLKITVMCENLLSIKK